MQVTVRDAAKQRLAQCKTAVDLFGAGGYIIHMIKDAVEHMLQAEMTVHLQYEKSERTKREAPNYRNGYSQKTIRTMLGETTINIPRDRAGKFEPKIIGKCKKNFFTFDKNITLMYAKGITTRDIKDLLKKVYGTDVSATFVSHVTDKILDSAYQWQNRKLARRYHILYIDAITYKVHSGNRVVKSVVYNCYAINEDGERELLGTWVRSSEGATTWGDILQDLRDRGVEEINIVCMDGLKGLPEVVNKIFPNAKIQRCIVHLIRDSLRHVSSKQDKQEFAQDLHAIYMAETPEEAEAALKTLEKKWLKTYGRSVRAWTRHWNHIKGFLGYPKELRRIFYTNNAVESLHSQLRKVTKNRYVFAHDKALFKLIYLAYCEFKDKNEGPIENWPIIKQQLEDIFGTCIGGNFLMA